MIDEDELDVIRKAILNSRGYASMREGGTKEQKELGVVTDLLKSMRRRGEKFFINPRLVEHDPPDCMVETLDGQLIAFEVTEFVSQAAIEHNQRVDPEAIARFELGALVFADWREADVLAHIQRLLVDKDRKHLRGGPYARYAVVIHTDEPLLIPSKCETWLTGHVFGPFQQLDEAYLLYPYEPGAGYLYSRLEVDSG